MIIILNFVIIKTEGKIMITIYTSPSCSSCRKVKKWFDEQEIPYIEKNIFSSTLNEKELQDILAKTENGTEDIISNRSKIVKENGVDLDKMTIKELISFIKENPSILKRPIMVDDRKLQVGYNPEEISVFIPRAKRIATLQCCQENCDKYPFCEHIKDLK